MAVLAGKILPKALYAVSTAPAPAMAIKKLTSHMATCLDPRAAKSREPHLVLSGASDRCLDPSCHIFATRACALRRAWFVAEHLRPDMQDSMQ
eukprot:11589081-Alexandrium_andersonii.AAC.1